VQLIVFLPPSLYLPRRLCALPATRRTWILSAPPLTSAHASNPDRLASKLSKREVGDMMRMEGVAGRRPGIRAPLSRKVRMLPPLSNG
jgi:hypothetical protein